MPCQLSNLAEDKSFAVNMSLLSTGYAPCMRVCWDLSSCDIDQVLLDEIATTICSQRSIYQPYIAARGDY